MKIILGWAFFLGIGVFALGGCTVKDSGLDSSGDSSGKLSGTVTIDGSSTVFPISQAVAEEFQKQYSGVKVVVGTSGTGGGFKKFVLGEIDINDASRPIKQKEIDACRENGIEYIALKVAIDGLSVIVNPENDWCRGLTVAQLKSIWEPDSKVTSWSDVDSKWPEKEIRLYGPDTDSGTFDYFTEAICGEGGASRTDYTPSTDDNVLVRGVSGDQYSLGYFGYAYYVENKDKLKIVGVAPELQGTEFVEPTDQSIETGEYTPLSRPLFLYVNKAALKRPEVATFVKYYLAQGQNLASEVGYIRLSQSILDETRKTLRESLGDSAAVRAEQL